ncbi:unnamed protein product [Closterium sp. NIES-65]|nr:unnamed protein product [Closterium sp. NIES-65]
MSLHPKRATLGRLDDAGNGNLTTTSDCGLSRSLPRVLPRSLSSIYHDIHSPTPTASSSSPHLASTITPSARPASSPCSYPLPPCPSSSSSHPPPSLTQHQSSHLISPGRSFLCRYSSSLPQSTACSRTLLHPSSLHRSLTNHSDTTFYGRAPSLCRPFSNLPDSTVYGGPKPEAGRQRVTLQQVGSKYRRGEPIVMVTAYDYPSAVHVDMVSGGWGGHEVMADIDICLVDSAPMVLLLLSSLYQTEIDICLASPPALQAPSRFFAQADRDTCLVGDSAAMVADIDICLVGDSAAMVVHGYDTTLPITLEDMLLHCRAVARGASRPLLVGDLPFGTYEQSPQQAVNSAVRLLKEGNMDAVKIEGGIPARVAAARAVSEAGIAVMGHVGLTPQAISSLGGFRPQGRSAASALKVVQHAQALQEAGCFAVVLECMPAVVGAAVTAAVDIPTIGIGAGPLCSGQVLVYHDLLGMIQHPHHAKVTPKFCKAFGQVGEAIQQALNTFREDVTSRAFPSARYSPYKIDAAQVESFTQLLKAHGLASSAEAAEAAVESAAAEADALSKNV